MSTSLNAKDQTIQTAVFPDQPASATHFDGIARRSLRNQAVDRQERLRTMALI